MLDNLYLDDRYPLLVGVLAECSTYSSRTQEHSQLVGIFCMIKSEPIKDITLGQVYFLWELFEKSLYDHVGKDCDIFTDYESPYYISMAEVFRNFFYAIKNVDLENRQRGGTDTSLPVFQVTDDPTN